MNPKCYNPIYIFVHYSPKKLQSMHRAQSPCSEREKTTTITLSEPTVSIIDKYSISVLMTYLKRKLTYKSEELF